MFEKMKKKELFDRVKFLENKTRDLEEKNNKLLLNIEKLENSEKRYRELFENSIFGMFQYTPDKEIISLNSSFAEIFGYDSPEEIINNIKDFGDAFYVDPKKREEVFKKVKESSSMVRFENEYIRKDKSVFMAELHMRLVRDEEGRELYYEGFIEDITERKKAEKALVESEIKWRTLYENLPGGSIVVSRDYIIQDVNELVCSVTGYKREELVGSSCDIICPKGPHKCPIFDMGKEKLTNDETAVKAQSGVKVPVLKSVRRLPVPGKELIIENFHVITLLKETQKALAQEKERLAVTLRSIGECVISTDINGKIELINNAAELLTGWTQEEAAGKSLKEILYMLNEESREKSITPFDRVIQNNEKVGFNEYNILISRDGQEKIISDTIAPIKDNEDNITGFVLVFHDVTEKRKMELERLKAHHLEALGILAGGIAHDFNNLLTSIIANITLARSFIKTENKAHKRLLEAEKASDRARALTKQLLTFSRGGVPVKEVASIGAIVEEATVFSLRGSNVKSEFFIPNDLWTVEIDEGQMCQAINNIVINADQAMEHGGLLKVSVNNIDVENGNNLPLEDGKYIKIDFEDEGHGISEEIIEKIFNPYFTTREKSSGLGLATVYSIIRQHGGHINVKSEVDKGTCFTIYLPAGKVFKEIECEDRGEEVLKQNRERILLMDDEEIILDVAAEALSTMGFRVSTCTDGKDAVYLYKKAMENGNPFSAVIMDLTVPGGMGGRETMKKLLEIDPEAKGIVSSGYSNDPVIANYRDYGFIGVVPKPYTVKELYCKLSSLINGDE